MLNQFEMQCGNTSETCFMLNKTLRAVVWTNLQIIQFLL